MADTTDARDVLASLACHVTIFQHGHCAELIVGKNPSIEPSALMTSEHGSPRIQFDEQTDSCQERSQGDE